MPKTEIKYDKMMAVKCKEKHRKKASKIGKGDMSKGVRKAIDDYSVNSKSAKGG